MNQMAEALLAARRLNERQAKKAQVARELHPSLSEVRSALRTAQTTDAASDWKRYAALRSALPRGLRGKC